MSEHSPPATPSDPPPEPDELADDDWDDDELADDALGDDEVGDDGFAALGLRPEVLAALTRLGYEEPTPIQRETIPLLLAGNDLIGQAATGTGKTAAFALPLLERLGDQRASRSPVALVLVPTRELAIQVSEAVYRYGRDLGAQVLPIYGGQHIGRQLQALDKGVHVVVATPGRALDHIGRGTLRLADVQVVVLDEADEMLDMGFAEDIEAILEATPTSRQTVLFSATMPPRIEAIAARHLRKPVRIQVGRAAPEPGGAPLVDQRVYIVARAHKAAALGRVLDVEDPAAALVFCRTRIEVDQLTETLNGRGYRAEALHGGMSQEQRDRVMSRLRTGTADLLVATDVAARGLDIDQLTHVVNYDVPSAPESYVHRIGRVGRAGRAGVAITLAEPREQRLLKNIERVTGQKVVIEKVPTVADLRARQMDQTLAAVRESLDDDELDRFRAVLDVLVDEHPLELVALAAIRLAHAVTVPVVDDEEIPEPFIRPARERTPDRWADKSQGRTGNRADNRADNRGNARGPGRQRDRDRGDTAPFRGGGQDGGRGDGRGDGRGGNRGHPRDNAAGGARRTGDGTSRLYLSAGRSGGIRPQDIVGAIANETSLSGRDIGAIHITERFSLVEVPDHAVDEVIAALRRTRIKGREVTARRDRDQDR